MSPAAPVVAGTHREPAALSEIALTGVYEISKILASPARLEVTLANVLNLLSSFMHMRDGVIALLGDDGTPEMVVGAGWRENAEDNSGREFPRRQSVRSSRPQCRWWCRISCYIRYSSPTT